MGREIIVKGLGQIAASPDQLGLVFDIHVGQPTYAETLKAAAVGLEKVQQAIAAANLKKKDLKTSNFRVEALYDQNKGKEMPDGYICNHHLEISFPWQQSTLEKLIKALEDTDTSTQFHIVFSIKNRKDVVNDLLKIAVADAKEKAKALAYAAGVTLGEILRIEYDPASLPLESGTVFSLQESVRDAALAARVIPEDIQIREMVQVVWEIR